MVLQLSLVLLIAHDNWPDIIRENLGRFAKYFLITQQDPFAGESVL